MKKRVLLLTLRTFSATGGIEKVCKVLGKAFGDLTAASTISSFQLYSMYDHPNEVDGKYVPATSFKGFHEKKIRFVFASVREGCKQDVVVLSHINLLLIGILIKMLSPRTKLVLLAHGIEVWSPLSWLKKSCLRRCDQILAVSSFTRDRMKELFQLQTKQITVLNNCLDPYLAPVIKTPKDNGLLKKIGFQQDDFILLTLTRLSSKERYKGYDHVLQSVKALKTKYANIKYLILGRFDNDEVARVKSIVDSLGIQEHVYLAGFIPDGELASYFNLADLYIMPSKKEGFGIVFIEAMYYGVPVIAGNKDGSCDALLNGKMGTLVDPDSLPEIDAAIESVYHDRSVYRPDQELLIHHFGYDRYKQNVKDFLQAI